jgi:hypothetical protein
VDCDQRVAGRRWDSTIAALERHEERPFERLEPHEVARRSGSAAHRAGVFEATAATVQAALLARGLRRVWVIAASASAG